MEFTIERNNVMGGAPCGVCGDPTDPNDGIDPNGCLDVFVRDESGCAQLVCAACIKKHVPDMYALLQLSLAAEKVAQSSYFSNVELLVKAASEYFESTPRGQESRRACEEMEAEREEEEGAWSRFYQQQAAEADDIFDGAVGADPALVRAVYQERFGACPECGQASTVLNIGREHWFVCHDHKIKWHVGSNLFSAWKEENQETWDKNADTLSGYREVEPVRSSL